MIGSGDTIGLAVERAVDLLVAGGVIGLPTETVYGLAADAGQREAVARLYRIKGRPSDHPLIVHVLDLARCWSWADLQLRPQVAERLRRLATAFWPGPLTVVVVRHPQAPAWACAGQPTIALRVPAHPVAQRVLRVALTRGVAGLAAPSANRYGRVSPTRAAHVRADLNDEVALTLDGGDSDVGIESTIVDLSGEVVRILRPGAILAEQVYAALALPMPGSAGDAALPAAPRVPGDRRSHYAPSTAVRLVASERLVEDAIRCDRRGQRLAIWSCTDPRPALAAAASRGLSGPARGSIAPPRDASAPSPDASAPSPDASARSPDASAPSPHRWRQRPSDATAMARQLYDGLRTLDSWRRDLILIEQPPDEPRWAAVNDRLVRASTI